LKVFTQKYRKTKVGLRPLGVKKGGRIALAF